MAINTRACSMAEMAESGRQSLVEADAPDLSDTEAIPPQTLGDLIRALGVVCHAPDSLDVLSLPARLCTRGGDIYLASVYLSSHSAEVFVEFEYEDDDLDDA